MAGQLTISTLSDGVNSTSSTNCIQGSAKAWVNYNGAAKIILASYNVSSVTYNSSGNYTINFTNALTDANYSCVGSCTFGTGISWMALPYSGGTKTTTALQVGTVNNNAYYDFTQVSVTVNR